MLGTVSMATGLGTNKVMGVFSIHPCTCQLHKQKLSSCSKDCTLPLASCLPEAPSQVHGIQSVYIAQDILITTIIKAQS